MSRRDDRVSLIDMLNYAAEAVELAEGKSLDDVLQDRVMQLALLKFTVTMTSASISFGRLSFKIYLSLSSNSIS